MTPVMLALPLLALLLVLLGWGLARMVSRESRMAARILAVQRGAGIDQAVAPLDLRERGLRVLQAIGGLMTGSGIFSGKTVAELEQTLQSAGFRGDRALAVFVGAKLVSLVCLPVAMWGLAKLLGLQQPLFSVSIAVAGILGLLLPDIVAKRLRRNYIVELERSLPDALDLMVICAEAGLALEATIERVSIEIRPASRAMATEFALCDSELRILPDRRQALLNMAERTQLDLLRRVATTLVQSLKFGTPLTQALRSLSAEMRQEQMTRFEARAARLPVLLTVPMILFILPTLVLVTAGPAMIQVWGGQ